jgi:hypothetical protein
MNSEAHFIQDRSAAEGDADIIDIEDGGHVAHNFVVER